MLKTLTLKSTLTYAVLDLLFAPFVILAFTQLLAQALRALNGRKISSGQELAVSDVLSSRCFPLYEMALACSFIGTWL